MPKILPGFTIGVAKRDGQLHADDSQLILITGANGNLGRRLLRALDERQVAVRAVVRSQKAAATIADLGLATSIDVRVLDYLDKDAMGDAVAGCRIIVHLVGIIKETANSRYVDAHERTCEIVAELASEAGVERIVYLSIAGTEVTSTNACLASKANAEGVLRSGGVPALILRVPMVLGEGDYASRALNRRAHRRWNVLLRGSSREQPIYAGDVIAGILAGLETTLEVAETVDLAGLSILTRAELTRLAARKVGGATMIFSLPLWMGMALAWLMEHTTGNPPVTRAMLGVLDHDDDVDPAPGTRRLGIALTTIDVMLTRCLQGAAAPPPQ